jgi:hypothetical protein
MSGPITELKWDARIVTVIPGNTAYWFFVFFWQTKGSRNKNILERKRYDTFKKGENMKWPLVTSIFLANHRSSNQIALMEKENLKLTNKISSLRF